MLGNGLPVINAKGENKNISKFHFQIGYFRSVLRNEEYYFLSS